MFKEILSALESRNPEKAPAAQGSPSSMLAVSCRIMEILRESRGRSSMIHTEILANTFSRNMRKTMNNETVTYEFRFPDEIRSILMGAVDLHCHAGPSMIPRRIDGVDAAMQAAEAGLSAVLIKDHHFSTARDVLYINQYILKDRLPVKLFGGIALNQSVGGLNPHAVEAALHFQARIVYLPTVSSRSHKEHHEKPVVGAHFPATVKKLLDTEPIYLLDENGKLLPTVKLILEQVRDADAVLSTGHLSVREILAVLDLARDMGLKRVMVNHPTFITEASDKDMLAFAAKGAIIEFSACMTDPRSKFYFIGFEELCRLVRLVGIQSSSIGSDLGQHDTPPFVEGMRVVADGLMGTGMKREELALLFRENPEKLLY
jgi:hypothetical protein